MINPRRYNYLRRGYVSLFCTLRFCRKAKIDLMSPTSLSEWQDEHILFMGRPMRSLSGTVAGFSPQISHIFLTRGILYPYRS